MEESDNHSRSFNSSDIRQYLDGKLSAAEMHAMEKAALDDPFLADALEGISAGSDVSFESSLDSLKKSLLERVNQPEKKGSVVPLLMRWQAVAALLLLIFSAYISYVFLIKRPSEKREIAVERIKERVTDSSVSKTTPAPATAQPVPEPAPAESDIARARPSAAKKVPAPVKKTIAKRREDGPVVLDKAAELKTELESVESDKHLRTDTLQALSGSKDFAAVDNLLEGRAAGVNVEQKARRRSNSPGQGYLQGLVTDSSGNPISSATVSLKNKKTGVTTDPNGFFKLKTDSRDSSQDVVVSSVGYTAVTEALPLDGNGNTIRMPGSGSGLNDVVVTALGTPNRKKEISSGRMLAKPIGGWIAFNLYLSKNKNIGTADSTCHGVEIISFLVHKNGDLSDFKIEQSVSSAHDAELIRLIKTGPVWKPVKGNKQQGRVNLNF